MIRPPAHPHRTLGALVAVVAAVGLSLGLAAGPAGAHGGAGQMEPVSVTRADGDAVDLVVSLTYVEDGHGVPDATVTAVVGDAAAVPLAAGSEEGQYQGRVDAPAGSTIRVTSVEPVVTLEVPAPAGPTTTTAAPTTTEAPTTTSPSTTAAPSTTDGPPTSGTGSGEGDAVLVEDEDDGLPAGTLIAIGATVAVVGAAGVFIAYSLGRRKEAEGDDLTSGPDDPAAGGPAAGGSGTGAPPR